MVHTHRLRVRQALDSEHTHSLSTARVRQALDGVHTHSLRVRQALDSEHSQFEQSETSPR